MNADVRCRKMNTKGVLVLNQCRGLYLVWYQISTEAFIRLKERHMSAEIQMSLLVSVTAIAFGMDS